MNRREQLIALRGLHSGSYANGTWHHNSIYLSEDLKRICLFHTSDVDIGERYHNGLFMCACPHEARQMWQSYAARKRCSHVNVFSVSLDEVPINFFNWSTGDCYEIHHGGRCLIWDVSKLKFECFTIKSCLYGRLSDLHYYPLYCFDAYKLLDYFIFENNHDNYLWEYSPDNKEEDNNALIQGMFDSHSVQVCMRNCEHIKRIKDDNYIYFFGNMSDKFNW